MRLTHDQHSGLHCEEWNRIRAVVADSPCDPSHAFNARSEDEQAGPKPPAAYYLEEVYDGRQSKQYRENDPGWNRGQIAVRVAELGVVSHAWRRVRALTLG